MKKIFLLLTIIFSQAQVSFTNSEDLSSQVIAEKQDTVEKNKPESFQDYCNQKLLIAKIKLNNSYNLVKDNPGKSILGLTTLLLLFNYLKKEEIYAGLKRSVNRDLIEKKWQEREINPDAPNVIGENRLPDPND